MNIVTHTDGALDSRSIDALLERYVSWREECVEVRKTYRRWADSECGQDKLAYGVYLAALDREEHAARSYADQVERVVATLT